MTGFAKDGRIACAGLMTWPGPVGATSWSPAALVDCCGAVAEDAVVFVPGVKPGPVDWPKRWLPTRPSEVTAERRAASRNHSPK